MKVIYKVNYKCSWSNKPQIIEFQLMHFAKSPKAKTPRSSDCIGSMGEGILADERNSKWTWPLQKKNINENGYATIL